MNSGMPERACTALPPAAGGGEAERRAAKITHVDVDAFFASVEQVLDPRLRGKPVLVGRGVVASASYEAKARGVRTAMSFREALRRCPEAISVAGQYEHYAEYAVRVRRVLEMFTPAVETAALDDFYLDFTGTDRLYPDFKAALREMQRTVFDRTGLGVSIGVASSKVVAAVASRMKRPLGFWIVPAGTEETFLGPLPVERLHGIGHAHAATLRERGIATIRELREVPLAALEATFGEVIGRQLWERARGIDSRAVHAPLEPKSVSRETTIEGGTIDPDFLGGLLEYLAERIGSTLRGLRRQARTLTVKVRYMDSYSAARAVPLRPPTSDEKSLLEAAQAMFRMLFTRRVALRWMGLSVTNLEPERRQNEIFDRAANRRWYLNRAVDAVRERHGWNAVFYGKGIELRRHYAAKPAGLVLSTPCLSR